MPPPFHITGAPNLDWIIFIAGALVCLYWLRALRLAREGARLFLCNLALAVLVFLFGQAFIPTLHLQDPKGANLLSLFIALAVFYRKGGRRSRHIPVAVARAVKARDLKGKKYDGKKHHIDHVWAFSSWGSHTTDNLRVIDKKKNLKKGAKRPRFWEMW